MSLKVRWVRGKRYGGNVGANENEGPRQFTISVPAERRDLLEEWKEMVAKKKNLPSMTWDQLLVSCAQIGVVP
jgi:hypothetical protein